MFTKIVIYRQTMSGLSIYLIVLNFLKIWDNATGTVELRLLTDRYAGTWKNLHTGEFFRVISFKSVIRCEYVYENRYISTNYVGIKHLFDSFKFFKNLGQCDRDCGTWKNSRPVRRDLEKFPDQ
jgi:hypothetical protein